MKHLHQNQGRKPIHTVSITTDTGKTAVLTHSHTLFEFIMSNLIGNFKVYYRKYLGFLNILSIIMYQGEWIVKRRNCVATLNNRGRGNQSLNASFFNNETDQITGIYKLFASNIIVRYFE